MNSLKNFFVINTSNTKLVRALIDNFNKQVPLLYFVLCANAVLCAANLHGKVPAGLTLHAPATLVALCGIRMVVWLRARNRPIEDHTAVRKLKGILVLGVVVGLLYLSWCTALFMNATDAVSRMHVVFTVAMSVLASMCCLLHLRAAARVLAVVISAPVALYLMVNGQPDFFNMGVNLMLVVATMIYVTTVTANDFEKMVELGAENARLANVDSLTSLPNRRHFFESLEQMLEARAEHSAPFAVGVLDIDGFKSVNDVFGHVTGDHLLVAVGERMQSVVGGDAMIARLGGDEFGVLIHDARMPEQLLDIGGRICGIINQPIALKGAVANVSASIGLAVFPVAGRTAEVLYERADYALYHAKEKCRGTPVIFSEAHEVEIRLRGQMEQCMRKADLDAELSLHFQPLVDITRGGVTTAFEALARWTSPELGVVPPSVFVEVAERSDLIHRLTHILLRKALHAVSQWPAPVGVSFNLSMRDLVSRSSIDQVLQIVRESGVDPSRIEFEITESALMADFAQATEAVGRLRELGSRISLDDFGTGYSSLSHVHRLPLDKIKVDRSFITDIESRGSSKDILRTVIDLCNNLNIQCVVEGTETVEQINILKELGCNAMQGYYFARPMTADQVPLYLARGNGVDAQNPNARPAPAVSSASPVAVWPAAPAEASDASTQPGASLRTSGAVELQLAALDATADPAIRNAEASSVVA